MFFFLLYFYYYLSLLLNSLSFCKDVIHIFFYLYYFLIRSTKIDSTHTHFLYRTFTFKFNSPFFQKILDGPRVCVCVTVSLSLQYTWKIIYETLKNIFLLSLYTYQTTVDFDILLNSIEIFIELRPTAKIITLLFRGTISPNFTITIWKFPPLFLIWLHTYVQ